GGEQQMVAIGRGLMARPKILMLDEPPLGPAPVLLNSISETIRKIADQGTPCCWLNRMWTIHCACQTGGMSWSTAELELKSL
ncbi:MAG: hypothetical protein MI799_23155, partial [Desulfobacterales bacterium]|nr:hypothetical protein [Desulfobacterales bacterium]